ncbi:MAG: choice-of-anchor tandem repeat GloVer-containing protein [Rhodospirillales bacterium]
MSKLKQSAVAAVTGIALGLGASAQAAPLTFTSLYSFPANSYNPVQVVDVGGQLYGVTQGGGETTDPPGALGVIFHFDPTTGAETVLTSFSNNFNGYNPAGLISLGSRLLVYTTGGGQLDSNFSQGSGTIFNYNRATGRGRKFFDFIQIDFGCHANDLLPLNGQLYGTCNHGVGASGNGDNGILFQADAKTGAGKILYSFSGGADGGSPTGAVVSANGVLYGAVAKVAGTTANGGVFSYDLATGTESLLHQFAASNEGSSPSGVVLCNGMVAGFNQRGGAAGMGTAFSIDPSTNQETTLYTFQKNNIDGSFPFSWAPSCMNKWIYGAAARGGTAGVGTVFGISMKTGKEAIVHNFAGPDGSFPYTSFAKVGGTLYGTTNLGGTNDGGTIFKLAPK